MADDKEVGILKRFPRVFWVAQTFEMMERGAYYSMVPILIIHAIVNLGLPVWLGGIIFAFMYPFQYGLPILTGALAEKVGYKKQIIFAFTFLTISYVLLATAFNAVTLILAVVCIGASIGSYKPLISATVAKCTTSKDRNVAYGIYYWVVNLAAFIFPMTFVAAEAMGYLPISAYYVVFWICAIMVSINIVTAAFIFEEVPRTGKVKTVGDAVGNVKTALSDKKFLVMVFLIGGFWSMYAATLIANPVILLGYRWVPWFVTAMALGLPNPGTIILLGNFISRYIEKIESLRVMMMGVLVYLIGLSIMCIFLQTWWLVFVGIIVYSIGEFMVAPGYLAFVSKLASKEQVSAYIGCNFISNVIGLVGGTIVFGLLVAFVGVNMGRPYLVFGIIIAFGFILLFVLMMYYRTWGQDIIARAKRIRAMEEGEDDVSDDAEPHKEPAYFRIFDMKITGFLFLLLVPIVLIGTYATGTFEYLGPEVGEDADAEAGVELVPITYPFSDSGSINENSQMDIAIGFDKDDLSSYKRLTRVDVQVTWDSGETSTLPLGVGTNEPDNMGFTLTAPMGDESETASSSSTGSGSLKFTPALDSKSSDYLGDWTLTLDCGDCGDSQGPGGRLSDADTSSGYSVTVSFVYDGVEEKEK